MVYQHRTVNGMRRCAVQRLMYSGVVTIWCLLHWVGWGQVRSAYKDTLPPLSLWPRPQHLSPTTTTTMGSQRTPLISQCGLFPLWQQSLNTAAKDRGALTHTQDTQTTNIYTCMHKQTYTHQAPMCMLAHSYTHTHTRARGSVILTCFALWTIHISPNALHKHDII